MPAIGVYASNQRVGVGLRMRVGALRNGPAPADHLADPGLGGLATGTLALRFFLLGSGWAELAGGAGVTGRDLVPSVEAGAGWMFELGALEIGPSVRVARVISRGQMDVFGTASLVLAGIDLRFGKRRVVPPVRRSAPEIAPRVEAPARAAELDRDRDRVVEREQSCAERLDGCRISEEIAIENDRIILDERVLFDLDRARVRTRGRVVVAEIAKLWQQHPDWQRLTIEGHADVRGTDAYNEKLSLLRAERVRRVMVQLGLAESRIDTIGYGRSRPRDPGGTEHAHQRNRRVEFVIDRGGAR
ncbi:MAG: OmpA family protein [Kofleriaceae bacterium]